MIELLIKKHQVNDIFYVSGSELENKDAKKKKKRETEVYFCSKHEEFDVPVRIQGQQDRCVYTKHLKNKAAVYCLLGWFEAVKIMQTAGLLSLQ